MFSLTSSHRYYFYRAATDMRKGFDSLCGTVQTQMSRNPMSGEVFIFINRPRNRIKLLHWETGGFTLYYKRLEQGNLELPEIEAQTVSCTITWTQLVMMVEGISMLKTVKRKRYISTIKS